MIKPITNQEINQSKVASLPARPNASTAFGGAGYTSAQLKQAFDRLPLLLAERYNALVEAIFASDQNSLSAHIPTGITGPEGENYSLYDLLQHIKDGTFATYLKVGESDLDLQLKTLAPLDSPAFLGNPTALTPALSDASGRIATTEWVKRLYADIFDIFEGIKEGLYGNLPEGGKKDDVLVKTSDDNRQVAWTDLKSYSFDTPTATTQAPEDSSTKIATTAFVQEAIAKLKEIVDALEKGNGGASTSITVDQVFSPESENPQSGKAVAKACEDFYEHATDLAKSYTDAMIGRLSLGIHTDGLLYVYYKGTRVGNGVALPDGGKGDVIGTLDENNNILLTGELADGTYTLKYENTDGTYTEIGSLVVAEVPEEPDNGLAVPTDSTAQTDWEAGNWCNESYIGGSSYSYRAAAGTNRVTTNTIAVENGDTIYVKGINYSTDTSTQLQVALFNANGEYIYHGKIDTVANNKYITEVVGTEGEDYFSFKNCGMNGYDWGTRFIRLAGWLSGTAYDVIITRNEPIE